MAYAAMTMPSKNLVRNALQERPVHEGSGVALVGVTDQVLRIARRPATQIPFDAGRESRAAAPTQAGTSDLGDHLIRLHGRKRLSNGRICAPCYRVLDPHGIDAPAVGKHVTALAAEESSISGNRHRPAVTALTESLDGEALAQRHLDDIVYILGLDSAVQKLLWLDHNRRSQAARAMASGVNDTHLIPEPRCGDLLSKRLSEFDRSERPTPRHAHEDAGAIALLRGARFIAKAPEIGWCLQSGSDHCCQPHSYLARMLLILAGFTLP